MCWKSPACLAVIAILLMAQVPTAPAQQIIWLQYDSGSASIVAGRPRTNDTCGVWFAPPTQCKLLAARFMFGQGDGGNAHVFVYRLAHNFNPNNYVDCHVAGNPGPRPLSTVWAGPIPYTFNNNGTWQTIVFNDYGYTPDMLNVGDSLFYIGYRLLGGGTNLYDPAIYLDSGDTPPFNSLMYMANPGAPNIGESGWWGYGYDMIIQAQVNEYGDPPPSISGLIDRPDTYTPGPYIINAYITDLGPGGVPGQVTVAQLRYRLNGGPTWTNVTMTHVSDSTYQGSIPSEAANTTIDYCVFAQDNSGHTAISPNENGYRFSYLQPTPGAHILLVSDKAPVESQDFYTTALQAGGYAFDSWHINPGQSDDQGYPGSDVVNRNIYSTLVWFTGTANPGSLPDNDANLATDPVAQYMNAGGNFFLSSSDYIGAAFNPDVWTEFTAIPGTFMYQYLKVGSGWSDGHPDAYGFSTDSVYYGLAGDPISGPFTTPFYDHPLQPNGDPGNWNDYCYPVNGSGAVTCFHTQIDDEDAGIRYAGTYKMVFLPWILEACDDSIIARGILWNVISYFTAVPPALDVNLIPINPPIQIPATGGSFRFAATAKRLLGPQAPFAVWARMKYPNGSYTGPVLGPVTINPPVNLTVSRQRTQNIPGSYPAGVYTYLGYGNTTYSYPAIDSASFTFTKLTTGTGPYVWDANCTGELFPGEVITSAVSVFAMVGATPNPFNLTTNISFTLPEAVGATLNVYDVSGRLVANLVDGLRAAGQHQVTFDGSNLSSGVYLYSLKAGVYSATGKMVLMK